MTDYCREIDINFCPADMPAIHLHSHVVLPEEIDPQGHANNIRYFDWLQTAAVAHSTVQGWSGAAYQDRDWAWVVRTHRIEYRRPAFAGDEITIRTWVSDMRKYTSLRKYEVLRNDVLLARAETNWAFVDSRTATLLAIPEEVSSAFELVTSARKT